MATANSPAILAKAKETEPLRALKRQRIHKKAALLLTDLAGRMSDLTSQNFTTLERSPLSE